MSSKGDAYREMVEDVIAGGLLDEDEVLELRDLIARVERQMRAKMPAQPSSEAAE
jgi:hypothetical protein